jgi:amino acid transporter
MAVVVIAGSVCAATTLFTASARMIGALAQLDMLPRLFRGSTHRNIPAMAMLAAAVGAMMALGFAGSMHLEIFIRAGFLLWLLHTALIHGLAWGSRGVKMRDHGQAPSALSWLAMPAAPILGVGAAILWATDVDRLALLIYLSTSWCLATVVVLLAKRLCRRGQQQPIQPATPNPP